MPRSLTLALVLLASACGGGEAMVVGHVLDPVSPLSGVTVSGGRDDGVTDDTGRFAVPVRGRGSTVLVFEKEGFAPSYRAVTPGAAPWVSLHVALTASQRIPLDVSRGEARIEARAITGETLSLTFPPDSVRTERGKAPPLPIEAEVSFVVRPGLEPPVPLVTEGGDPLTPFGVLGVRLRCGEKRCVLAEGQSVAARFPTAFGDPLEARLFYGDAEEGRWTEEGTARVEAGDWVAELPHLSWWTLGEGSSVPPAERACVRLFVVSPAGRPLTGALTRTFWNDAKSQVRGTAGEDGSTCYEGFPSTTGVELSALHYLGPGAARWKTAASTSIVPTAVGRRCSEEACESLFITLACASDGDCGDGWRCDAGDCLEGTP